MEASEKTENEGGDGTNEAGLDAFFSFSFVSDSDNSIRIL